MFPGKHPARLVLLQGALPRPEDAKWGTRGQRVNLSVERRIAGGGREWAAGPRAVAGGGFLYVSDADGWFQVMHLAADGRARTVLTSGSREHGEPDPVAQQMAPRDVDVSTSPPAGVRQRVDWTAPVADECLRGSVRRVTVAAAAGSRGFRGFGRVLRCFRCAVFRAGFCRARTLGARCGLLCGQRCRGRILGGP